jgi:hypothetical protein
MKYKFLPKHFHPTILKTFFSNFRHEISPPHLSKIKNAINNSKYCAISLCGIYFFFVLGKNVFKKQWPRPFCFNLKSHNILISYNFLGAGVHGDF